MRAVRYHETGGTNVLQVDEIDCPKPGDNEALIDVSAIGVNPVDTYFREGSYEPPELPMIPGSDFAGVIEETGGGVERFKAGDRVFGTGLGKNRQGTYAEHLVSPVDRLTHLPQNIEFIEGAAIALVGVTAWRAIMDHGSLRPEESCFIHGGSGGVGHVAVQLAALTGAEISATAGSEEKRERVLEMGADHALDYDRSDLAEAVKRVMGKPNVILDHMMDIYLQFDFDIADFGGRIVGIGESDAEIVLPNTPRARGKELTVHLMSMFNTPDMSAILEKLSRLMEEGTVSVEVAKTYDLEEAAEAQRAVLEDSYVGKLVITP